MSKQRYAALDCSFLLALAAGSDDCHDVIDWLGRNNIHPLVTTTVIQELEDIINRDADAENVATAKKALTCIPSWNFLCVPLSPLENGLAEIIGSKLAEKGVISDEHKNDGIVIAETSLQGCVALITYRESLVTVQTDALKLALMESDVTHVFVLSPDAIVEYLRSQEKPSEGSPGA